MSSSQSVGGATMNYTWDVLNRMTAISAPLYSASYMYRSDGLRTSKSVTNATSVTTDAFRYDGQMPFEDETISGTSVTAVRCALGARGVDAEEKASGRVNTTTSVRTLVSSTIRICCKTPTATAFAA